MPSWIDILWGFGILCGMCWWIVRIREAIPWFKECFSYHTTLRHVLRTLQRVRKNRGEEDLETLNVDVVSERLIYHHDPWWPLFILGLKSEGLDGWVLGLKKLNFNFIVQVNDNLDEPIENKVQKIGGGRIVTYSIRYTLYHMYFASDEYEEPDAVVILDNESTMLREEDTFHSEISYRNMTSQSKTVVVLVDTTDEQLDHGVRAVNEIRPIVQEKLIGLKAGQYMTTESSRYRFALLRRKDDQKRK